MSLLCAFYLTEIVRLTMRIPQTRLRLAVISFPTLLLCGGTTSKMYNEFKPQLAWYLDRSQFASMLKHRNFDDVMEASDFVRSATRPDETVWINSTHLMINSLADRSFPGRHISYAMVRFDKPSPLAEEWRREVEAVFRDRPPRFIILEEKQTPTAVLFNMGNIQPHEPISVLKQALENDDIRDRQIGRFIFFARKGATTPSTPR